MTLFRRTFCALCDMAIARRIHNASMSGLLPDNATITITLAIYLSLINSHNGRTDLFLPDAQYLLSRYSVFMNILNMISDGLAFPIEEKVIFDGERLLIPHEAFKKAWNYMKTNRVEYPMEMAKLSAKAFPKINGVRYLVVRPVGFRPNNPKFIVML